VLQRLLVAFPMRTNAAMITDPNDNNPYRSPEESSASADVAMMSDSHRPSPWRIVPVILLYLYGGLNVLFSAAMMCMIQIGCSMNIDGTHSASASQLNVIMYWMILVGARGCFLIAAGRNVWSRRWIRGAVFLAIAVVLYILSVITWHFVERMPPGKEFRAAANAVGWTCPEPRHSSITF
jgi:hypothetical protein